MLVQGVSVTFPRWNELRREDANWAEAGDVYEFTVLSRGDLVAHQFADDLHFDGKPRPSLREKVKSGAGKSANRLVRSRP